MTDNFVMMKGYEGKYWIDPEGNIMNNKGKILKPKNVGGVNVIELYGQGVKNKHIVQALVLENFGEGEQK